MTSAPISRKYLPPALERPRSFQSRSASQAAQTPSTLPLSRHQHFRISSVKKDLTLGSKKGLKHSLQTRYKGDATIIERP